MGGTMQLHSIQATLFRLKLPILLAGIAVAAIIALILGFSFPQPVITQWFSASGYYFILSAFGLWMFSLLPSDLPRAQIRAFLHRHGLAFGLAVLLSIGAFVISPPKFRILADETNLIGMSAAM